MHCIIISSKAKKQRLNWALCITCQIEYLSIAVFMEKECTLYALSRPREEARCRILKLAVLHAQGEAGERLKCEGD